MKIDPWLVFQVVSGSFSVNTESVSSVPVLSLASTTSGLLIQGFTLSGVAGAGAQAGELGIISTASSATNTFTLDGESVAVGAPARFVWDTQIGFGTGNRMATLLGYDAVTQRWRRVA